MSVLVQELNTRVKADQPSAELLSLSHMADLLLQWLCLVAGRHASDTHAHTRNLLNHEAWAPFAEIMDMFLCSSTSCLDFLSFYDKKK